MSQRVRSHFISKKNTCRPVIAQTTALDGVNPKLDLTVKLGSTGGFYVSSEVLGRLSDVEIRIGIWATKLNNSVEVESLAGSVDDQPLARLPLGQMIGQRFGISLVQVGREAGTSEESEWHPVTRPAVTTLHQVALELVLLLPMQPARVTRFRVNPLVVTRLFGEVVDDHQNVWWQFVSHQLHFPCPGRPPHTTLALPGCCSVLANSALMAGMSTSAVSSMRWSIRQR